MKKAISAVLSFAFLVSFSPTVGTAHAAASCPDVDAAKAMLKQMTARTDEVQAPRSLAGARQDVQSPRSQDIQSPRSNVQAPRSQDVQSPRTQDIQAPRSLAGARSQDVQAPRSQDIQSPRSQDVQAPRSQDIQ